MYRLFMFKSNARALQNVVRITNTKSELNQRLCSLCQKLHLTNRSYSTNTILGVKQKRHRKKRKSKTYSDVLVVTNQSTVQQKATVQKLSAGDLKAFASANLDLSEWHKIKGIKRDSPEHTYNNLAVIDDIPSEKLDELQSEFRRAPLDTASKAEFLSGDYIHTPLNQTNPVFQPETLEDDNVEEPEATAKSQQLLEMGQKEEIISHTLAAYIEVCSFLGTPQRGLNALVFHRTHTNKPIQKYFPIIKNVNVYNALLKGFTAKKNFPKLQEVLSYAKQDGVVLNSQSYAIIFECLGRCCSEGNNLKHIRSYSLEALKLGFTFDRIMNEAVFSKGQREMALSAMKAYDPQYQIVFVPPYLQYDNQLVNALNVEHQLNPPPPSAKCANKTELIKRQMDFEKHGFLTIKSVEEKPELTVENLKCRRTFGDHVALWEKDALQGFTRDLLTLTARRGFLTIEPYLRVIPAKEFVQIIVEEAKRIAQGSENYSPTCNILYKQLGEKVYAKYKVLQKQKLGVLDKILDVHSEYCTKNSSVCVNPRQRWQWIEHRCNNEGSSILMDHCQWVPSVLQNIGKFLYQVIMHDLKIDVNAMNDMKNKNYLPAFYTVFRTEDQLMKEEVKPHPVLSKLYRASVPDTLTFPVTEMPMVCPPLPWCSTKIGGYLVAPCDLIRLPSNVTMQKQRLKEAHKTALYPSIDSLNQLGSMPWKVNTKILDVVLEVFNSGGSDRLNVPEPPSTLPPVAKPTPDMNKSQRYQLFRQRLLNKRKRNEMYSLWCDCLYRLSLANHFRKDVFWLPHNMDFRGRVYPLPPHLNHLGSDLARSMLIFAEGKPLGPNGLDWLKLHLVNLTGLKKRDQLTDRLIFANEVLDKILDSADYPLTGKQWWAQSESPWQTLACCMEIAAAHRCDNPEEYVTQFPVHQDGSCNGLQHYAALGRDTVGATSVNLAPSHKPQDVYSSVVLLVEEQRKKDASAGITVAKVLERFVTRKVIKQTIMTTVYGVTKYGARLQIARQLKDLENFPKEYIFSASNYLTVSTFDSLRTMFTSAREIQDWFTECAQIISSLACENVEWVTPLGLPIVQPYTRRREVSKGMLYEPYHLNKYEKPNLIKQKNAFPPNFIHSLDSTHMMLTSLHCERAGISFVSVHDCYWTHPSTVAIMNKICREQFVALHSEPILENLSAFLLQRYTGKNSPAKDVDWSKQKLTRVLSRLPQTNTFDIRQVLESVYFFS